MTKHTEQDDRFDRRELLLHVGDMLDAARRVADLGAPDAPVAQLVGKEAALRRVAFLEALAPSMTAARFGTRVASAFAEWPRALLDAELDRNALARDVQRALFDGDAAGWAAYVTHLRDKVAWFAEGVGVGDGDATTAIANPPAERPKTPKPAKRAEKKGWPWPEPRS